MADKHELALQAKIRDLEAQAADLKRQLREQQQEASLTPRERRARANRRLQEGATRNDPREVYLRRRGKLEEDGGEAA